MSYERKFSYCSGAYKTLETLTFTDGPSTHLAVVVLRKSYTIRHLQPALSPGMTSSLSLTRLFSASISPFTRLFALQTFFLPPDLKSLISVTYRFSPLLRSLKNRCILSTFQAYFRHAIGTFSLPVFGPMALYSHILSFYSPPGRGVSPRSPHPILEVPKLVPRYRVCNSYIANTRRKSERT